MYHILYQYRLKAADNTIIDLVKMAIVRRINLSNWVTFNLSFAFNYLTPMSFL
jgi:hypothetical protein